MGTPQWNLPLVHLILKQYTRFTRKYTPKYPRTLSWYSYPSREQEQSGMNSSDQWTVNSAGGNTWPDVRFFCRPVTAQVPAARLFFSSFFCPSQIHSNSLFHFGRNVFKRKRVFLFWKVTLRLRSLLTPLPVEKERNIASISSNIPFVFIYLSTFLGMCCWHWLPSVLIESRNS